MRRIHKLTALFLSALLLLLCTACEENADDSADKMYYGDPDAKNSLRIVVDFLQYDEQERSTLYNFAFSLQESGGLKNFVIEILPDQGAERMTAITRLRTEIMAGAGPDVFILAMGARVPGEYFIPYPEKMMENGMFLPLDTYMENNSRFTNWNDQQQTVLAAGRNEDGQQIIPLSYSFPVVVYPQADLDVKKPDTLLTWNDTLTDQSWKDIYAPVNDLLWEALVHDSFADKHNRVRWEICSEPLLEYVLGRIADYRKEELLFTEEELTQRIEEVLALRSKPSITHDTGEAPYREYLMDEDVSNKQYNVPITLLPLYSDDGGVTVTVAHYAAVNRNTTQPDNAYTVIDLLMRESTQLSSPLFSNIICNRAIPLNNKAYHPDSPVHGLFYLDEASYKELADIREQITTVNFDTELLSDINVLLQKCEDLHNLNQPIQEAVHEVYEQMQRKIRE